MINPKEFLKNFVCDKNIITLYNFHLRYYSGLVAQNTVRVYTFSPVSKPTISSRRGDQKKIPERAQSAAVDWARRTAACCTDEASHLQAFTGIQFTTQTHTQLDGHWGLVDGRTAVNRSDINVEQILRTFFCTRRGLDLALYSGDP